MVHNTRDFLLSALCPSSGILKYTTFRKLHMFLSSRGRMGGTCSLTLGRKQIHFQKSFILQNTWTMDKVQKLSNLVYHLMVVASDKVSKRLTSAPEDARGHPRRFYRIKSPWKFRVLYDWRTDFHFCFRGGRPRIDQYAASHFLSRRNGVTFELQFRLFLFWVAVRHCGLFRLRTNPEAVDTRCQSLRSRPVRRKT
jgi:hypothetical protein